MCDEAKWAHFRSAIVEIQGPNGPYVVGPRSVLGKRDVTPPSRGDGYWIITAENPNGIDARDEDNAAATDALRQDLDDHDWVVRYARGGDLTWAHTERSFAVIGPTEEQAVALGRKYRQLAIFGWDHNGWSLISCVDDRREEMEWGSIEVSAAELSRLDESGGRS